MILSYTNNVPHKLLSAGHRHVENNNLFLKQQRHKPPLLWDAAVLQAIWDWSKWFIWNPDISQQNLQYSGTERVIMGRVIGTNKANTAVHFLWQSPVFKMIVVTKEKHVVVDFLLSAIYF